MRKYLTLFLAAAFIFTNTLSAQEIYTRTYTNRNTNYTALIKDEADLLSKNEEVYLLNGLLPITKYGNVSFYTTDKNLGISTGELAQMKYDEFFGSNSSGIIFVIDMNQRWIWIYSNEDMYQTLTSEYIQSVTDKIYKLASDGDFYLCAAEAFRLITARLDSESFIYEP